MDIVNDFPFAVGIVFLVVFGLSWFYVWRSDKIKAIKEIIKGDDQ